jgi:hypothetical protein
MMAGLKIYGVNHLFGRQDKSKAARDRYGRMKIHRNSQEIIV